MSDFPSEVCYEILLRVPAEPLFRFRLVCKAWCCIINHAGFVQMHLQRQDGEDQLIIGNGTGKLYLLPLSSIDCSKNHTITVEMTNINNLVGRGVPGILDLPVPSNSGLILIEPTCANGQEWTVWNPITGESFQLPPYKHLTGSAHVISCGIGYDSATDDFKVVMIVRFSAIIYSLKLNYWKSIPNFKEPTAMYVENGVFVNGALHWIIRPGITEPRCILSLDLITEEDRVLPMPSFLSKEQDRDAMFLDVLDGCLCLRNDFAIWIMKDYGKNVWSEFVSFEQLPDMKRPIAYMKGKGQVIFQLKTTELLLFDVAKKCAKKLRFEGVYEERLTYQAFTSSLFRLNKSAGGDGSIAIKGTLKRKRKTANNRLKVELKISDAGP